MTSVSQEQFRRNWKGICDDLAEYFSKNKTSLLNEIQYVAEEFSQICDQHLLDAERPLKSSVVKSSMNRPEIYLMGNPEEFLSQRVLDKLDSHNFGEAYYLLAVSNILTGKIVGQRKNFGKRFSREAQDALLREVTDELLNAVDNNELPLDAAATYSYQTRQIYVFQVSSSDISNLNVSDETHAILMGLVSSQVSSSDFKSFLRHEVTHAYLDNQVNNLQRKEKDFYTSIVSINEGAAHVVGQLTDSQKSSSVSSYRRQKIDISKFKTAENILYRQAENFMADSSSSREDAISFVRDEAVEAIMKISSRGNIDIAAALTPEYVREAKRLEAIINLLDKVDYYTLDMARFLGLENGERERKMVKKLSEAVETNFVDKMLYEGGSNGELFDTKNFMNSTMIKAEQSAQELIDSDRPIEKVVEDLERKQKNGEVQTNFLREAQKAQKEIKKIGGELDRNPELAEEHPEILDYLSDLQKISAEIVEYLQEGRELDDILEELISRMDEDIDKSALKHKYYQNDKFSPQNLQEGQKDIEEELWKIIEAHDKFLTATDWTRGSTLDKLRKIHGRLVDERDRIERDFRIHPNERNSEKSEREAREARWPSNPKEKAVEKKEAYKTEKEEFADKLEEAEFEVIDEFVELTKEMKLISEYFYHIKLYCREWIEEAEKELEQLDFSKVK